MSTCVNIISQKETFKDDKQSKNDFQLRESVDESWQAMETVIYESAKPTYGVLKTAQTDWVREGTRKVGRPKLSFKNQFKNVHDGIFYQCCELGYGCPGSSGVESCCSHGSKELWRE